MIYLTKADLKYRQLILLFFCVTTLRAQVAFDKSHAIDSLVHVLKFVKHDSLRVLTIFAWDNLVFVDQPELDLELNKKIQVICEKNLKQKLKLKELIFFKDKLAAAYNNLGMISADRGNYPVALDFYTKSLFFREELKDKKGAAFALGNLGNIYYEQKELDKAMEFYKKSLALTNEINNKAASATSINNIANIYADKKDNLKAIEYYMKSLTIGQQIDDQAIMSFSLNNIGNLYKDQKDFKNAIYYYQRSLNLREFAKDIKGISSSVNSMGLAYLDLKEVDKAMMYFLRGLDLAKQVGLVIEIREAAKGLHACYKLKKNYKVSLEMHELYLSMRDSLENEDNLSATMQQEYRYKYAKKAASDSIQHQVEQKINKALLAETNAKLKQEQTQRYALYGGLCMVILFTAFLFNRFRVIKRQKQIIEEKEIETNIQKGMLEEKQKEIIDSIHYAKRIQEALMPSTKRIAKIISRLKK